MPTYHLRACAHDRTGYYHPRWDKATRVTVTAPTEQEALSKADAALGEPRGNRRAWYWGFRVDRVEIA